MLLLLLCCFIPLSFTLLLLRKTIHHREYAKVNASNAKQVYDVNSSYSILNCKTVKFYKTGNSLQITYFVINGNNIQQQVLLLITKFCVTTNHIKASLYKLIHHYRILQFRLYWNENCVRIWVSLDDPNLANHQTPLPDVWWLTQLCRKLPDKL